MSQSLGDTIERSFHGYLMVRKPGASEAADFNDIRRIVSHIEETCREDAGQLLLDMPRLVTRLYLARFLTPTRRSKTQQSCWTRQPGRSNNT